MAKYNFETRRLSSFRSDWALSDDVWLYGELWYIKEEDGLYLLDTKETRMLPAVRPYGKHCVAKGLPAALLAHDEILMHSDFDFVACYNEFYKAMQMAFPDYPVFHFPKVIDDWKYTLLQLQEMKSNTSGLLGKLSQMRVAVFLRDLANPYHIKDLENKINCNFFYTCKYPTNKKEKLVFSHMPTVNERAEAPMILACDLSKDINTAVVQADGFSAAIINLSIYYFWKNRWSEYDFTNIEVVDGICKAYKREYPIIDIVELKDLSFDLPIDVEDICRAYMTSFEPIMRKVWRMNPEVQRECIEGDNIYTYIYAHENSSPDKLFESELFANFTAKQQRTVFSYIKRFIEWMERTYPITMESQQKVMRAMAKDIPPIQLTIQNDVQIIQPGGDTKGEKNKKELIKFAFIISDDKNEILKIHKRIEMYLLSPAKLRDELRRLKNEGLVALPMENPTEIARELQRVWGDKAPKLGSFKTTWGRVKC